MILIFRICHRHYQSRAPVTKLDNGQENYYAVVKLVFLLGSRCQGLALIKCRHVEYPQQQQPPKDSKEIITI